MYGHHRFYTPVKFIALKSFFQIDGHQTRLPVMAVNNIWPKADYRKHGKRSLGEKCKFLQVPGHPAVRPVSAEMLFIVYKIKLDTFIFRFQNSDILLSPVQIHIKARNKLQAVFEFLLHTGIFRNNDSDIKILFRKAFRQRTNHIRQAARFNKRNRLRCYKQYIFM